jgi:hypothetical protein
MRNVEMGFVSKPDRKKSLGRQNHRWDNNIDMIIKEMGERVGCRLIHLTQDKD